MRASATQYPLARPLPPQFRPSIEHPGGCYTCRFCGERRDVAVWCARPGSEHATWRSKVSNLVPFRILAVDDDAEAGFDLLELDLSHFQNWSY